MVIERSSMLPYTHIVFSKTVSIFYLGFPRERVKNVFSLQMSVRVERAWCKGSALNKHAQRLLLYQHYANIRRHTQRKLLVHFLFPIANRTLRHLNTWWPSQPLSHQYARKLQSLKQCEIITAGFPNVNQIFIPSILFLMTEVCFHLMISVILLRLKF